MSKSRRGMKKTVDPGPSVARKARQRPKRKGSPVSSPSRLDHT